MFNFAKCNRKMHKYLIKRIMEHTSKCFDHDLTDLNHSPISQAHLSKSTHNGVFMYGRLHIDAYIRVRRHLTLMT
jgi:hypothetical protein